MSPPVISIDAARLAKDMAKQELAGVPGLVGIGLTRRGAGYALKVNLDDGRGAYAVPRQVNGVPLVVEVVGPITKR